MFLCPVVQVFGESGSHVSAQYDQNQNGQPGFWRRFNSWWERGDASSSPVGRTALVPAGTQIDDSDRLFPQARLRVLEGMFGSGYVAQWPERRFAELTEENQLDKDSRVLVLGSGPGGSAHLLSEGIGATVMAIDDRIEMADIAQNWLRRSGSTAKFERREFFDTDIRPGFADLILAPEGLSHLRDKRRLFRHLMGILRPSGRIIFDDFFVTGEDPECPEVAVWSALDDRTHHLTDRQTFDDIIYDIGFDHPAFEDRSDAHVKEIRHAYQRGIKMMEQAGEQALSFKPWFVEEVDRWNRRLALLQSGEARHYRVTVEYYGSSAVV